MSFRNRSVIAGANGPINLSVPLVGGRNQKTLAKDVKIDNTLNWQIRHYRAIVSTYNRSPFFEFAGDGLHKVFSQKRAFLFDWNLDCMIWLREQTGLKAEFSRSEIFETGYPVDLVTDLRNQFLPANIKAAASSGLAYRQVFEDRFGFQPGMSVLDFLFCAGGNQVNLAGITQAGIDLNQ